MNQAATPGSTGLGHYLKSRPFTSCTRWDEGQKRKQTQCLFPGVWSQSSESLDVTFSKISSDERLFPVIGVDIQDENGRHEVGFVDKTEKIALDNGIGCRFESKFEINKVRPEVKTQKK